MREKNNSREGTRVRDKIDCNRILPNRRKRIYSDRDTEGDSEMDEILELSKMEARLSCREQKREKHLSELVERLKADTLRLLEDIRKELRLIISAELRDIIRELRLESAAQKEIAEEIEGIETEATRERTQMDVMTEDSQNILVMLDNLESEVKARIRGAENSNIHPDN